MKEKVTLSGEEPEGIVPGAPAPIDPKTGMHKDYWVLSKEERDKGFIRPVRTKYVHKKCGVETTMNIDIAETYARDPSFYGSTFCVGSKCRGHFTVGEFIWSNTNEVVGSLESPRKEDPAPEKHSDPDGKDRYLQALHDSLTWAMDILDMYDKRLVDTHNEPEHLVMSDVHVASKKKARTILGNALSINLVKEKS